MILVPEIRTVVLLVPRTGTTALRRALLAKYPQALPLYRHMEADGVPAGYDRWRKVGFVRDPVERLWSLYRHLGALKQEPNWAPGFAKRARASVARPFSEWIVENEHVFSHPYDSTGTLAFWPRYTVRHPLPENRKSQFVTLRPDLGTQVWQYDVLRARAADDLGVDLAEENAAPPRPMPALSDAARAHVERWMVWDLAATRRSDARLLAAE